MSKNDFTLLLPLAGSVRTAHRSLYNITFDSARGMVCVRQYRMKIERFFPPLSPSCKIVPSLLTFHMINQFEKEKKL